MHEPNPCSQAVHAGQEQHPAAHPRDDSKSRPEGVREMMKLTADLRPLKSWPWRKSPIRISEEEIRERSKAKALAEFETAMARIFEEE